MSYAPEVAAILAKLADADKSKLTQALGVAKEHGNLASLLVPENTKLTLAGFYSCSPEIEAIKRTIGKLAILDDPVLITGETGTGKKIIAKSLHGSRKGQFITINCSSLPDYLLESELFGHERGSFTGAETSTKGLLRAAADGTILLDEIGDMPIILQCKLLVVLDELRVRPVGGVEFYKINCRFLAATSQSLDHIRSDLLYRLATFEIDIPPLRNRLDDVDILVRKFDEEDILGDEGQKQLADQLKYLQLPGNVREVKREVKRAIFNKLMT